MHIILQSVFPSHNIFVMAYPEKCSPKQSLQVVGEHSGLSEPLNF